MHVPYKYWVKSGRYAPRGWVNIVCNYFTENVLHTCHYKKYNIHIWYDKMRWDEVRWDEVRWDEMRWDEMRWDETRWDEMIVR